MISRTVSISLAAITLLAVGAVAWWSFHERTSPGPLHPSHAGFKELKGNAGCTACHGEGEVVARASMMTACNACHTLIAEQANRRRGLHGQMGDATLARCEQCHHDHLGSGVALVTQAAFKDAGIADVDAYDHAHVGGLSLTGKHVGLACVQCHTHSNASALDAGQKRYLGLTQACIACHEDVHKGELGPDCAKCHGQEEAFKSAALFKHPETFPLTLGHAKLQCGQCHTTKGEYTGLKLDCASCHQDEFDKTSKPNHALTGIKNTCVDCHTPEKWTPATFTHTRTFALVGAHAKAECNACHGEATQQRFTLAYKASPSCASCHMEQYRATTKPNHAVAKLGQDCATCHTNDDWKAPNYKHSEKFVLVGEHAALACAACHAEGRLQAQVDRHAQEQSCVACHASPHREAFVVSAANVARASDACLACHQAADTSWTAANARLTPALHAATGFPLSKPHDKQTCVQCHTGIDVARKELLAQDEWLAAFPGRASGACELCHKDPHAGQFGSGKSKDGACVRCHETVRFSPTNFGVAMHAATAFPLDGSHKAVACALCHKEKDGVRQFKGTQTACVACHEDYHKGSFDEDPAKREVHGKVGCARCHTTESFAMVSWTGVDHMAWTGEPLTGKHARATCAQCHRREPAKQFAALGMFRPAPRECAACHTDPHAGQLAINGNTDCARCHESNEKFLADGFDHDKDSRFVLDKDHVKLACDACHKPHDVSGVTIVRYKPLGTLCADCHDPRGMSDTSGGR